MGILLIWACVVLHTPLMVTYSFNANIIEKAFENNWFNCKGNEHIKKPGQQINQNIVKYAFEHKQNVCQNI